VVAIPRRRCHSKSQGICSKLLRSCAAKAARSRANRTGFRPRISTGMHVGASCLACDKTANRGRDPARFQSTQVAGVDEGRALPAARAGGIAARARTRNRAVFPLTATSSTTTPANCGHSTSRSCDMYASHFGRHFPRPRTRHAGQRNHVIVARVKHRVNSSLPPGPQSRWWICPVRPSPGCANRSGAGLLPGLPAVPSIEERPCPPGRAPALASGDPGDAWVGRMLHRHAPDVVG